MATITYDAATPGKGATRPVFAQNPAATKIVTGQFSFDNSYPTGGEDLADIAAQFRGSAWLGLLMEDPTGSAGTGKKVVIDDANKKAMLFDNALAPAQVLNATDQSGAASLRFIAWGYR